jgi:TolB protein
MLAWSRDGSELAFVRGHLGGGVSRTKMSLFVSDGNGFRVRRLVKCGDSGDCGSSISWSPQGSRIVVTNGRDLELVDVKTRFHRLVPPRCGAGLGAWNPAWSPDGSKIAYGCGASLYLMTLRGRQAHVIATVPGNVQVGDLAWSPDGRTLAFDTPNSIYTVASDGSHLTRLLAGQVGGGPEVPSWSPDGTRIVYFYTPGAPSHFYAEVWVMNADGTQHHRIYRSKGFVGDWAAPVWSPDGKQIAFSIFTNAESGLMVMHADGSSRHRVAPSVEALAWQSLP